MNTDLPLPERLRLGTRDLHAQTERTGAMAALLAGRLPRAGYCALLRNLHALYAALESGLRRQPPDAAVLQLHAAPLQREAVLADDLLVLHGPHWRTELPLQPAAQAYAARLDHLADGSSPALVAHVYVRYLGDLHGGQILRRRVAHSLGLAGNDGTRFYDFGDEARVLALRQGLRTALAALALDAGAANRVVDEARWAFLQHQQLFSELADSV